MNALTSQQQPKTWLARGALLLAVLLLGARSFSFDYVEFDDPKMFFDNPYVQTLSAANLHWMFTDSSYNNNFYTPLLWLLYAVSGAIFGFSPHIQHVINVLLHAANALLVFEILRTILAARLPRDAKSHPNDNLWPVLIATLFWALHPLRVEVFGWIAARVHLHATLFALASCWAYCQLRLTSDNATPVFKRGLYWFAVVLFGLSMLAFPTAATLPLALGIFDWYVTSAHRHRKPFWRLLKIAADLAPFFAVAAIPAIISIASNVAANGDFVTDFTLSVYGRIAVKCYVLCNYLYATVVPTNLSPVYLRLQKPDISEWVFPASILTVAAISIITWVTRRRWPGLWCAWPCYIALMIPFIRIMGSPQFASDRYSYFSSIVYSALLAWLIAQTIHLKSRIVRHAHTIAAICILITLAAASFHQLRIWQNSIVLFDAQMRDMGQHSYRMNPMWRLAMHYLRQDDIASAEQWLQRSKDAGATGEVIEAAELKILLRKCTLAGGENLERRLTSYSELLEFCLKPHTEKINAAAFDTMQTAYHNVRVFMRKDESVATVTPQTRARITTLRALVASRVAQQTDGQIAPEQSRGLYELAYTECQNALSMSPDERAVDALGTICLKLGKLDEAAQALELAIKLNPEAPAYRQRLAEIRSMPKPLPTPEPQTRPAP